jgi:hypothetical protein
MIRANVEEDREATMARFLLGLNREISDDKAVRSKLLLLRVVQKATRS